MDNDSFNQLTLIAGIPWRIVMVLRAYCRYLLQTGLPFSQGYIAQVLVNNRVDLARLLADLFIARLRPRSSPTAARRSALARLDRRHSAPRSRMSRARTRIESCAPCGTRFRPRCAPTPISPIASGQLKEYLSFKIESQQLRELPLPKPLFEVFVFSPRMEGVHLRMGYRGARRHSLVGSARGFPHRSTRADEGAASEEHGDRPGRRQGRLRRASALPASARRSRPR